MPAPHMDTRNPWRPFIIPCTISPAISSGSVIQFGILMKRISVRSAAAKKGRQLQNAHTAIAISLLPPEFFSPP
ncbi:hypothetical protein D3C85_1809010 [compost metagenome]